LLTNGSPQAGHAATSCNLLRIAQQAKLNQSRYLSRKCKIVAFVRISPTFVQRRPVWRSRVHVDVGALPQWSAVANSNSFVRRNIMLVLSIEAPQGIRLEAKRKMMQKLSEAIDEAYQIGIPSFFSENIQPTTLRWTEGFSPRIRKFSKL
jgi:hypothetical protein